MSIWDDEFTPAAVSGPPTTINHAAEVLLDPGATEKQRGDAIMMLEQATGINGADLEDVNTLGELFRDGDRANVIKELGGSVVGGDGLSPDNVEAMIDREQATINSSATQRDVKMAEFHARSGNEVAADNVAAGAGDLKESVERAEFHREADNVTMMEGYAGETPDQTKERLAKEAAEQNKDEPSLFAGFMERLAPIIATFTGAFSAFGSQQPEQGAEVSPLLLGTGLQPMNTPAMGVARGQDGPSIA